MSDSTPPPCRVGSQNQLLCGPPCSSAARANVSGPIVAATGASCSRAFWITFMWIWFSKYAVGAPISRASATTRRASARLRASGFSQISPLSWAPSRTACRDLLHHVDAQEVGVEDRDDVDVSRHLAHTLEHPRLAEPARTDRLGQRVRGRACCEPGDLDAADRLERAQLELGQEPGADDPVPERFH